jgi:glucose-1-phosphate cytidylyltransferase
MNGGFFVFDQEIFSWMEEGEELVLEPFQRLAKAGRLATHKHHGFWSCMDTYKEKQAIDDRITAGDAPWEIWNRSAPAANSVHPLPSAANDVAIESAAFPAPVMAG